MKFVLFINLKLLTTANSFLLNLSKHENLTANKYMKIPTIVDVFIFISSKNFMFSLTEHGKSFITSEPGGRDNKTFGISHDSVSTILHDPVGKNKLTAHWIPKAMSKSQIEVL